MLLLAAILRFYGISHESLWTDEGYSLWFSQQSQADIWGDIARAEFNPVLYYSLLGAWTAMFGTGETALRSLSVVINCACLICVYLTARWALPKQHGPTIGLLASTLFALSFLQIEYSQEARTYALEGLGMALTLAASARIICGQFSPHHAPYWSYALLGAGAALMVWSHYTAMISLGLLAAFHGALVINARGHWLALVPRYAVSAGIFLALAGYALWLMVAYALPGSGEFWISAPSFADTLDAATVIFGAAFGLDRWGHEIALRALIFAPWPLLGLWAAWRTGQHGMRAIAALMVIVSAATFAAFLAISFAGKPVFLQRVLVPSQLGWIVICAMGVLAFDSARTRQVVAGSMTGAFALGALAYHVARPPIMVKEPWRGQAAYIAANAPTDTRLFTAPAGEILLDYYLTRLGRSDIQVTSLSGPMATPPLRAPFENTAAYFTPPIRPDSAVKLRDAIQAGGPVWVAMRTPDLKSWGPVRAVMAEYGAGPETRRMMAPGPLAVYEIDPTRRLVGFAEPTGE